MFMTTPFYQILLHTGEAGPAEVVSMVLLLIAAVLALFAALRIPRLPHYQRQARPQGRPRQPE